MSHIELQCNFCDKLFPIEEGICVDTMVQPPTGKAFEHHFYACSFDCPDKSTKDYWEVYEKVMGDGVE